MMVKEAEAKQKWCPFARTEEGGASINRNHDEYIPSNCECLGSKCMMWSRNPYEPEQGSCGLVSS